MGDVRPSKVVSIVLEAPIPKMSSGDKTSLHVLNIYSDKQQLSQLSHKPLILGIGASKVLPRSARNIISSSIITSMVIIIIIIARSARRASPATRGAAHA